jgi:hypothetical protein
MIISILTIRLIPVRCPGTSDHLHRRFLHSSTMSDIGIDPRLLMLSHSDQAANVDDVTRTVAMFDPNRILEDAALARTEASAEQILRELLYDLNAVADPDDHLDGPAAETIAETIIPTAAPFRFAPALENHLLSSKLPFLNLPTDYSQIVNENMLGPNTWAVVKLAGRLMIVKMMSELAFQTNGAWENLRKVAHQCLLEVTRGDLHLVPETLNYAFHLPWNADGVGSLAQPLCWNRNATDFIADQASTLLVFKPFTNMN